MIKQHAKSLDAKVKAKIGQAIRGILFHKLSNASYIFAYNVDAQFVSKILFYEVDAIEEFIGIIPKLISIPFSLGIAMFEIWRDVRYYGFVAIAIFI